MYKINIFLHLSPTKMRYGGELAGLYVAVVIYSSIAIASSYVDDYLVAAQGNTLLFKLNFCVL